MMISIYGDWRGYQQAVAAFFREQGCTAIVEAEITGARARTKIDVFVTFWKYGIECRWVIECKLWKGHVEKKDVLTLKGVVEDVGADRGIIFCENGFQSGARDATRHTNILLVTSLEEFKRTVRLNETHTALVYRYSDQQDAPPIYAFPNGDQPQHLLSYGGRLFVANWETGNIAVVDPTSKSIESTVHLDKRRSSPAPGSTTSFRMEALMQWDAGIFAPFFPGRKMHYRNKWYADLGEAPLLFALGIHGQYLFVDRRNQLVIVMMSSQADPLDAELISLTMTAVSHFREIFALSQ